jgi:AraC-like DNA-binding protein
MGQGVRAWAHGAVLYERYDYAPGSVQAPPRHAHAEIQLGLGLEAHGEYRLRGGTHRVSPGAVSVIPPGEAHRSRDVADAPTPTTYRMLYLPVAALDVATGGASDGTPTFREVAVTDAELSRRVLALCAALSAPASRLERDAAVLAVASGLLAHVGHAPWASTPGVPPGVALARDLLRDDPAEDVALADLAALAGLSPAHLNRAFARAFGLPPHAYQLAARIDAARRLLADGWSVTHAAAEAGFHDSSHLSRHFKRLVGEAPGRYAGKTGQGRKIVQASIRPTG